jgi:hypothetical protein
MPLWTLDRDPFDRLVFTDSDGVEHKNVEAVRAFPISDPLHQVALLDEQGHELLLIQSLDELDRTSREIIESALAPRDFIPAITRVTKIRGEWLPCVWEVETDRGPTSISLENEDQIRRIGKGRVLITDPAGTRFQIKHAEKLDAPTKRRIERYL